METLIESNIIDQTISTIGLKKVPVSKYVLYQKGLTIDFCVLQQDAFHKLDSCTRPERLKVLNTAIQKLITSDIGFSKEDKEDEEVKQVIKLAFDNLRQWWKDWNTNAISEEQLAELPTKINQFIHQEVEV